MDKKKMTFSAPEVKALTFNEQEIIVKPYITFDEQVVLAKNYCLAYFFPNENNTIKGVSEWDHFGAEYSLRMAILHLCTNVDVYEGNNSIVNGSENIFYSGLWEKIVKNISNYNSFRTSLNKITEDVKKQLFSKNSFGRSINELTDKIITVFKEFTADMTPEKLKLLEESAKSISNTVENSSVAGIYKEASKQ